MNELLTNAAAGIQPAHDGFVDGDKCALVKTKGAQNPDFT
jgi:hypothetical protein